MNKKALMIINKQKIYTKRRGEEKTEDKFTDISSDKKQTEHQTHSKTVG
jgi:hypothetical protein